MHKDITYTNEKTVFLTERHAHGDFSYEIPIPQDGFYVVIVQASEVSAPP